MGTLPSDSPSETLRSVAPVAAPSTAEVDIFKAVARLVCAKVEPTEAGVLAN